MKRIIGLIIIQLLVGALITTNAQSGFDGLNAENISAVRIIKQSDMGFTDERNINDEKEINRIIYYLKKYNYQELGLEKLNNARMDNSWRYQIVLNGWREDVYLFDEKVFIGNVAFKLPPGMIREFDKVFQDL